MSWLSGRRSAPEPADASGHHSASLKELVDSLRPGSRHAVLDLGPPITSNVRFLSDRSCRVRIADLHRALATESLESRKPEAIAALFARLLPLAPDERFDALLAWDVLDYLRPDQVKALMQRLSPVCQPDALALVLLSTRSQIPARPRHYRIVDRETLAYDGPHQPQRPCPRHSQADLARMMHGFSVRRSVLLRNGVQECLLVRDGGEAAARARETASVTLATRAWFRRGRR